MEVTEWGFNAATIGFIGTVVFGILGLFSMWSQSRRIWRLKSGVSVPVSTFMYLSASFFSGVIYGIPSARAALVLHGATRVPLCLTILYGLKKFRGFTKLEIIFGAFLVLTLFVMSLSAHKELFFLGFMVGLVLLSMVQPWEIWKNKSSGAADPAMLWVFVCSTFVWILYWWATGAVFMTWVNTTLFIQAVATLALYYKYR